MHHVYFPFSAVVSLVSAMQDGGSTEVAMVGNEGMVGVCACMGGDTTLSGAVMQPLLRYAQALFVQLDQTSACHRHSTHQQLCCWLLLHQDHHPGTDQLVTQERIAERLGVRRETVTAGASKLQKLGLISYTRGHIVILDRSGLEGQSCECHAVVKSACDKLGDTRPTAPPQARHLRAGHGRVLPHGEPALRRTAAMLAT